MRDPITLTLVTPVPGYDREQVETISIRAPTGKDILECGFPYATKRDPRTGEMTETVHVGPARLLIARCASLLPSSVDGLDALDFRACIQALEVFFYYTPRKTSSTSSSSRENGVETAASSSA